MHRKRFASTAVLVCAVLVLAACAPQSQPAAPPEQPPATTPEPPAAPPAAAGPEIRIGVLAPTTGPFSAFGVMMEQGVTLALEEYKYTAAGRPIKVFMEDTKLDNELAVAKARLLDEQYKVDVIIGPVSGAEGLSVLDWATTSGVPVVVPYSAPEDMTMRKAVRNVIRSSWTGAQPMDPFGYYVARNFGWKRIYMIGEDYSYPHNQAGGFKRGFCRGGGVEVKTVWHPVGTEDFSSILAAIPQTGYDAVMYNGAGSDAVAFVKQWVDFGMDQKHLLIGQSNTFEQGDLPAMPPDIVGAVSSIQYVETLKTPEFIKFRDAYQQRFGRLPAAAAEHAYDSAVMVIRSIEKIGAGFTRDQLIDELRKTSFPDAPRGPFVLDEYANPVHNIYIRQVQEVDGQLLNVGLFRVSNVSQFGPYDPDTYMKQPPDGASYPPDECAGLPAEMLQAENQYEFVPMEQPIQMNPRLPDPFDS